MVWTGHFLLLTKIVRKNGKTVGILRCDVVEVYSSCGRKGGFLANYLCLFSHQFQFHVHMSTCFRQVLFKNLVKGVSPIEILYTQTGELMSCRTTCETWNPGIQVWQVCEKGLFAHSHFTIYWNLFKLLYFMELTYPTLGKGKSSTQKWFLMGCVSSLESILWKIHGTYKSAHLERKMIWTKPPLLCSFFSSGVYPSAAGGCEAILSLNLPACSYWDCRRLQAEKQAKGSLRVISPPPILVRKNIILQSFSKITGMTSILLSVGSFIPCMFTVFFYIHPTCCRISPTNGFASDD